MTTPAPPPPTNPSSPPNPGWFEDPRDASQLRYFDGIVWTAHTTPLVSPTAADSSIGRAQPVPAHEGSSSAQGQAGAGEQPPNHPTPDQPSWGQPPSAGQPGAGQRAAGQRAASTAVMGAARLPDGTALAAWWQRLLAWFLDNVLVSIIGALVALPWTLEVAGLMSDFLAASVEAARTGGTPPTSEAMMAQLVPVMLPISLISAGISVLWEVGFLRLRGATPGRMLLGIGVRPVAAPGRLSWIDALKRQVLGIISVGFSVVAALATFGSILSVMDPAWMLLDPKRQTLSDKVAGTVVVRTR